MMLATCPDETELLAFANGEPAGDAIDAHVGSCDACRRQIAGFRSSLDELRGVVESFDLHRAGKPEPEATPPAEIGRYKVLDVLDRGGQAWVFRVLHPTIRKEMVLKLSRHPLPPGETESGRLVTEARVLAELDHPAIARIYDLDFCREAPFDGHAFIVMEWVPGRTLFQYAKDHPVGWREAALLVAQVARAAAEAHRRGITHRDITHRNILIDDAHHPRLIDFGLARMGSVWATTSEPTGTIAGTPDFMAPEQAEARLDEIGPRTDVYALGAVLCWILRTPTKAGASEPTQTLPAAGAAEAQGTRGGAARSSQTVPRLEGVDTARVPESVRKVIGKAMQREPGARYQNADELAAALEKIAAKRSWKWPAALAGLVCAAVVALVIGIWFRTPPPVPPLENVVQVTDGGRMPLTSSRYLYLSTHVPKGVTPVAIWIDTNHTVELAEPGLARTASDDSRFDQWECWRGAPKRINPNDPSGTEFVLVVARRHPMSDAEVAALLGDLRGFISGHALPDLPQDLPVRIGSMEFGVQTDVSGMTRSFQAAPAESPDAEKRLGELRQHLRDAGYTFFVGEAFPFVQQPSILPKLLK